MYARMFAGILARMSGELAPPTIAGKFDAMVNRL